MARRSPQEKKALSYEKDGRNTYGENDKASRKAIPLRKRLVNRANRHDEERRLRTALGSPDEATSEAAESGLLGRRPKVWRKTPDEPLGQYLEDKRDRRERG
jgi:cell shape-determining protein MreC